MQRSAGPLGRGPLGNCLVCLMDSPPLVIIRTTRVCMSELHSFKILNLLLSGEREAWIHASAAISDLRNVNERKKA